MSSCAVMIPALGPTLTPTWAGPVTPTKSWPEPSGPAGPLSPARPARPALPLTLEEATGPERQTFSPSLSLEERLLVLLPLPKGIH